MAKKKGKELTLEEKLEQALVPREEWPYEVPENWCWCKLGSIIKVSSGKNLTTKKMNTNGKIPVFGGNGITGFHDIGNVDGINIIIGRVGAYCGSVYYIEGTAWVTDNALIVSYNEEKIFSKFLYWLLSFSNLRENDSSSAQPVISGKKIYDIDIPLPPLSEQQRIVERIESLYAKLDEAKEKVQAVLDESENRKAAILHKAFLGELTEKWRNESGVNIDSWKLVKMNDVIKLLSGQDFPPEKYNKEMNGIPYITGASNFDGEHVIINRWTEYASVIAHENDILLVCKGSGYGKVMIADFKEAHIARQIMALKVSEHIYNKYLYYYLQAQINYLKENGKGVIPGISRNVILSMELKLPSYKEQIEIVGIIENLLVQEKQVKMNAIDIVDKINIIKKSILAKAFHGELGTNDLSEPSSIKLLKEILKD